ncbi:MAG: gamma-glutamyl-gamma-aminobutyrate hydrolase family protein [Chloroflexi bacterium]|nr:gamma-glutamyl-gamma-aminobutyrate hydrolase family protein [Chloroflexota bacterium]
MNSAARVALVVRAGESAQEFSRAIEHGDGHAVICDPDSSLPSDVGGLMVGGVGAFLESETLPRALVQAIGAGIPVLGVGWGMHALNVALGGKPPVRIDGHGDPEDEPVKHPLFLSPGCKVSYTIAGSGWVTVPSAHTHGLMPGHIADGLLASVYAEDQVVEAIEMPGHEWLVGVQWPAHRPEYTPKGFDSLLLALVERSQR